MKKFKIIILASFVGFSVCFAIMYWLFHSDFIESLGVSIAAVIGGIVAEYLIYSLDSRYQKAISRNKKNINDISN